jgi:hypothetical protein
MQIRRRAMRRHADQFSDKIMASRVADVYRRVLSRQKKSSAPPT